MSDVPEPSAPASPRRLGAGLWWWLAAVVAVLLLAMSTSDSFAAFAASITTGSGGARTGTLLMRVTGTDGNGVCSSTDGAGNDVNTNAATCSTINELSPTAMAPGRVNTTSVVVTNSGTTAAAGFTLTFGSCARSTRGAAAGSASDICDRIAVRVTATSGASTTTVVEPSTTMTTAAAHGAFALAGLTPGGSVTLTFETTLAANVDNTYQGVTAAQPVTLQFTS